MLQSDLTVLVYEYEYWDPESQRMVRSTRPATLEAIRNGLGVPVLSSARRVSLFGVDLNGLHRAA